MRCPWLINTFYYNAQGNMSNPSEATQIITEMHGCYTVECPFYNTTTVNGKELSICTRRNNHD